LLNIFISYSRDDDDAVSSLARDLRQAGAEIMLDKGFSGGETWWTSVLEQIHACAVFVFALSNKSIQAKHCRAELDYAKTLGLPILPVQIGEIASYRDDPMLASQRIDYRNPQISDAMTLVAALHRCAASHTAPPDPLPEPPPHPYGYLRGFAAEIDSPDELSSSRQSAILRELNEALRQEDDGVRQYLKDLLRALRNRADVTYATYTAAGASLQDAPHETTGTHTMGSQSTAAFPRPDSVPTTTLRIDREPTATLRRVDPAGFDRAPTFHEDVHFTVYRPRVVRPLEWTPLLAFAHLGEPPLGADPIEDPIRQVEERARTILGDRIGIYKPVSQDSTVGLPEDAEITFALDLPGFDVDANYQTFLWINAFHMVQFQVRATPRLNGQMARGRLLIHHGIILLAELQLSIRVDAQAPVGARLDEAPASVRPYRKIFPSYSHADTAVVAEFERYVEALGDRYLRDVRELRSGEVWDARLCDFIKEADVFQLFWSHNAMASRYVEREWRYALSLNRPQFIRPTYWEEPMPRRADVPPAELGRIHFYPLGKKIPVPESAPTAAPASARSLEPALGARPPRSAAPPSRSAPAGPRTQYSPLPPGYLPTPQRAEPPPPQYGQAAGAQYDRPAAPRYDQVAPPQRHSPGSGSRSAGSRSDWLWFCAGAAIVLIVVLIIVVLAMS
jgi:hypothetical protein